MGQERQSDNRRKVSLENQDLLISLERMRSVGFRVLVPQLEARMLSGLQKDVLSLYRRWVKILLTQTSSPIVSVPYN